jgi:hypothetical protein
MAKNGKDRQKQSSSKHVTTRRVARWQREKRRQRITFLSGIIVVAAVLGIIIGGVIATSTSDWLSKVDTSSGMITIKKADYADQFKFFRAGIYNSSAMTSESPLAIIEKNLLVADEAETAGLSVTEGEVTDIIHDMFETDNESITDTDFQEQYQNMLENMGLSDKELREVLTDQLLDGKLGQYYLDQIPESGEQASVEFVVVTNESDAAELAQRWRNGEELAALSAEYSGSSDTEWFPKGFAVEEFDNIAFSLEIGSISDPFTVDNAGNASEAEDYYVIKVLDLKDDVIDDITRQVWSYNNYNTWYSEAQADKVERNPELDLAEIYDWAVKQLQ